MNINLHIVSPDQTLDVNNLSTVSVPGSSGELEILPGHTHLLTSLSSGFVKRKEHKVYEDSGQLDQYKDHEQKQEISGGIMHCIDDNITIITS